MYLFHKCIIITVRRIQINSNMLELLNDWFLVVNLFRQRKWSLFLRRHSLFLSWNQASHKKNTHPTYSTQLPQTLCSGDGSVGQIECVFFLSKVDRDVTEIGSTSTGETRKYWNLSEMKWNIFDTVWVRGRSDRQGALRARFQVDCDPNQPKSRSNQETRRIFHRNPRHRRLWNLCHQQVTVNCVCGQSSTS